MQLLYVLTQGVHLGIELSHVTKVLLLVAIERVPECPPYMAGLINYEGKSTTVIDLGLRLGINRQEPYSLDTSIVLCECDGKQSGIIVDKIIGIVTIADNQFQKTDEFNELSSPFLATIEVNSQLILLLNTKLILSSSNLNEKFINQLEQSYE